MNFIIIIPARLLSTRFPNKPLVSIGGKPMIIRTIESAEQSGAKRVIVATDHQKIADVVQKSGKEVYITKKQHNSGTERLFEVIEKFKFKDNQIVVNLQVDEPFIPGYIIKKIVHILKNKNVDVSTLAIPTNKKVEILDPNTVKVITDVSGNALYFSRSVIPWCKNYKFFKSVFLRHVGIYAYHVKFIRLYVKLLPVKIEKLENLEQLRILWYRKKIYVLTKNIRECTSINVPEDLIYINKFF